MATQLRLTRHQLSDLQKIRDVELGEIDLIIRQLKGITPTPLHPEDLRKALGAVLQSQDETIEALIRQMLSLHAVMGQMSLTVEETVSGLLFGIQNADSKWDEKQIAAWKLREPKLREILSLDSVRIVAKALNLSYQYPNLLRSSRILTDIRPVFNVAATEMESAVISHSLSLHFDNVDGDNSLTFALDEKDITFLKNQCERALLKAETARKRLEAGSEIRVVISGRNQDGNN